MHTPTNSSLIDELRIIENLSLSKPQRAEEEIKKINLELYSQMDQLQIKTLFADILRIQGKENEARVEYQNLYQIATELHFDQFKGEALLGLAEITLNYDVETAIEHAKNAVAIFQAIKEVKLEAKASKTLANGHYAFGDLDAALQWYNHTLDCTDDENSQIFARALANIALVYREKGQLEKANDFFLNARAKLQEINYRRGISIVNNNIAETYLLMGDYQNSLKYYNIGLTEAKEMEDYKSMGYLYTGLGNLWLELGDLQKSYQYLMEASQIYESNTDTLGIILNLIGIANYWLIKGFLKKSLDILKQAVLIINETGLSESKIQVFTLLAEVYSTLEQYDEAYDILKQASRFAYERESDIDHAKIFISRAQINVDIENFQEAEILLEDALFLAKKTGNNELVFKIEMVFARNFLSRFVLEKNPTFLTLAKDHVYKALNFAQKRKLVPKFIQALMIQAMIFNAMDDQESAQHYLSQAMDLAKDRDMTVKQRQVMEKISVISGRNLPDTAKSQLKKISITMAIEDLKKATRKFVESELTELDLAETFTVSFIIRSDIGPMLHVAENIDIHDPQLMQELIQVGSLYSVSLGQGHHYFQDLFGPLPFGKMDYRAFIYTINVKNSENSNRQNEVYTLICLIFPKKMIPFFYDRQKLTMIFKREFTKINETKDITESFLNSLRSTILSEFMQDFVSRKN